MAKVCTDINVKLKGVTIDFLHVQVGWTLKKFKIYFSYNCDAYKFDA